MRFFFIYKEQEIFFTLVYIWLKKRLYNDMIGMQNRESTKARGIQGEKLSKDMASSIFSPQLFLIFVNSKYHNVWVSHKLSQF